MSGKVKIEKQAQKQAKKKTRGMLREREKNPRKKKINIATSSLAQHLLTGFTRRHQSDCAGAPVKMTFVDGARHSAVRSKTTAATVQPFFSLFSEEEQRRGGET